MPVWEWALDIVGLCLLLALLYGIALIVRRRLLARHGGTFELSYRARSEHPGRGWLLGHRPLLRPVAGVVPDLLAVAASEAGVGPRPAGYAGRRSPAGAEEMSLYDGHVVAACRYDDEPWRSR